VKLPLQIAALDASVGRIVGVGRTAATGRIAGVPAQSCRRGVRPKRTSPSQLLPVTVFGFFLELQRALMSKGSFRNRMRY
jgi:hypothetical protein